MRRRFLLLGLLGLLGLVGVLGLVSGSSAATTGATVWGSAIEVPGIAALNSGGNAWVNSVSCGAADTCAAVGSYMDANGSVRQAFVVDEINGVWGDAIEVPGSETLNSGGNASLESVSCGAAQTCAAVGNYTDGSGRHQAFVVDETNGVWGDAIEVPGIEALNIGGYAFLASVSCASAGNCAAGGYYRDGSNPHQAFVVDETNGVWGNAIDVPGIVTLNTSGYADVRSVSCATAGNCAAVGTYSDASHHSQAFVVDETNGVWGDAIEVPGSETLNSGGLAVLQSVSCATAGNCTAGGLYEDHPGSSQVFVVDETNGIWGNAIEVPGSEALNIGGYASMNSVSCASAGNCAAGGFYKDGSGRTQVFVVDETNGVWGDAIEVPGNAAFNPGYGAFPVRSVSCATAGNCVAVGGEPGQAFVVSETNGVWNDAIELAGAVEPVPGAPALKRGSRADVYSVSCGAAGKCAASGIYFDGSGKQQVFVATSLLALRAGTTTCNGTYGGTGRKVVVPTGAVCTLAPGTHVTMTVTVASGGTLYTNHVTISGNLTTSGSATVCASKIGGAVSATGGSFALGGPGCAGNKISGNILVKNDANDVWVWGNTVKTGHTLTVKYGAGGTDSIVGNVVSGGLLVEYSGPPVEVSGNHAYTARCVSNKGQTGSGNTAHGTNTCPH